MEGVPWGGSEELWHRVANHAIHAGHYVAVCTKKWADEPIQITRLRSEGVTIITRQHTLATRIFRKIERTFTGKEGMVKSRYLRLLYDFNPDCVLISQGATFDFFHYLPIYYFVEQVKKPYYLISQFNFENAYLLNDETRKRVASGKHQRWAKFYFVSERNLQTAKRQTAFDIPNAQVISNPVNILKIGKSIWPANPVLQLACVARFDCSCKGQDVLMQTLAEPVFKSIPFKLNLFGKGQDETYLKELIEFYQLHDKVSIKGQSTDIDKIWDEHHVLVLPSIAEGTPLSLQECMLKGRPALVTDVGGNSSLITNGDNGFIAAASSVNCLKEKLLELFNTPMKALEEMGSKAFEKAIASIDTDSSKKILTTMVQQ